MDFSVHFWNHFATAEPWKGSRQRAKSSLEELSLRAPKAVGLTLKMDRKNKKKLKINIAEILVIY